MSVKANKTGTGKQAKQSKGMGIEITKGPIIKKGIDTYDVDEYARIRDYLKSKPQYGGETSAHKGKKKSKGMGIHITKGPIIKKGVDTYDIDEYARIREYLKLKSHYGVEDRPRVKQKRVVKVKSPEPLPQPVRKPPPSPSPPPPPSPTPPPTPAPIQQKPERPPSITYEGSAVGSMKRMLAMFEHNTVGPILDGDAFT